MHKGVILEIKKGQAIILTPDGQFQKVRRSDVDWRIGEEVDLDAPAASATARSRLAAWVSWASVAAAIVICLVVLSVWTGQKGAVEPRVMAYVTIDINPSVELGIDSDEKVVQAEGLNEAGKQILAAVEVIGLPVEDATEKLINEAHAQKFLDKYVEQEAGTIVITSTFVEPEKAPAAPELAKKIETRVAQTLKTELPEQAEKIAVETIQVSEKIREQAKSKGVSTGKMTIQILAKENGMEVDEDRLKRSSIHEIAKEFGGVGELLRSEKSKALNLKGPDKNRSGLEAGGGQKSKEDREGQKGAGQSGHRDPGIAGQWPKNGQNGNKNRSDTSDRRDRKEERKDEKERKDQKERKERKEQIKQENKRVPNDIKGLKDKNGQNGKNAGDRKKENDVRHGNNKGNTGNTLRQNEDVNHAGKGDQGKENKAAKPGSAGQRDENGKNQGKGKENGLDKDRKNNGKREKRDRGGGK